MESAENREQSVSSKKISDDRLSKDKAIALLQNTIQQLEGIVKDIAAGDRDTSVLDSSLDTLVATTQKLSETVTDKAIAEVKSTVITPTPVTEKDDSSVVDAKIISATQPQADLASSDTPVARDRQVKTSSKPATESTRTVAVKSPRQKPRKNRSLLIGSIVGSIAILAIAIWQFFPLQPTAVISQNEPTTTEIETEVVADTIDTNTQDKDTTEVVAPDRQPEIVADTTTEANNSSIETAEDEETEIASIDIPADLTASGRIKKVKLETIEPKITLSPEQTLVAAIQSRVTEITADYAEDLVTSVEADFTNNSLVVKVNDLWYELDEARQDKTANEILKRSRRIDFQKLEVRDAENILVARSPVVGDRAIVTQRTDTKSNES